MDIAQIYEFADITWYPSQYQAVYRYDNRVPLDSLGDGINDFIGFQSMPVPVYMAARATGSSLHIYFNIFFHYYIFHFINNSSLVIKTKEKNNSSDLIHRG